MTGKHAIKELVRSSATLALTPLERRLARPDSPVSRPVCFIVGPPRSGTSLLYELLATCLDVAYISNIANRLPLTPLAGSVLFRRSILGFQGQYESTYGHISGLGAPSEGGSVWNRWSPHFGSVEVSNPHDAVAAEVRSTVYGLCRVLGGPFVNKNVMHSIHMPVLERIFPGALFIRVRRDALQNARSIARARESGGGPASVGGWWSVAPRGWERYSKVTLAEQAAAQVHLVHEGIDRAAEHMQRGQLLDVSYEDVCECPATVLQRILARMSAFGAAPSQCSDAPKAFAAKIGEPLSGGADRLIRDVLAELKYSERSFSALSQR